MAPKSPAWCHFISRECPILAPWLAYYPIMAPNWILTWHSLIFNFPAILGSKLDKILIWGLNRQNWTVDKLRVQKTLTLQVTQKNCLILAAAHMIILYGVDLTRLTSPLSTLRNASIRENPSSCRVLAMSSMCFLHFSRAALLFLWKIMPTGETEKKEKEYKLRLVM